MASRHYRTRDPFRQHVHHVRRVNALHRRRHYDRAVRPFRRTWHQVDLGARHDRERVRRAGKVARRPKAKPVKLKRVKAKGPRKPPWNKGRHYTEKHKSTKPPWNRGRTYHLRHPRPPGLKHPHRGAHVHHKVPKGRRHPHRGWHGHRHFKGRRHTTRRRK